MLSQALMRTADDATSNEQRSGIQTDSERSICAREMTPPRGNLRVDPKVHSAQTGGLGCGFLFRPEKVGNRRGRRVLRRGTETRQANCIFAGGTLLTVAPWS